MKKICALILASILLLSCCVSVGAALPETNMPLWDNIISMPMTLAFNGTNSTASATITGKSGVTCITGTLTVYEKTSTGWVSVGSDSDTVETRSMSLSVTFAAKSNVEYKAVFNVSVTRNGLIETETRTVNKTC